MRVWMMAPLAVVALAGCGGSPPPPPAVFAPLDYSYLPPIVLKVASLTVANDYVPLPDAGTLIGQDPEPPAVALMAMLNRRLVPSGTPGTGTVTVQNASLSEQGNTLAGAMTVDVNLASADGRATGFTEASVSVSQAAPDPNASQDDVRSALYNMTKQLMDAMNVQLQYQIQHNLSAWLLAPGAAPAASGGAAGGVIQATPLTAPGAAPLAPAAPVAPGTVNTNPAVPNYLPGAGPAALTAPSGTP